MPEAAVMLEEVAKRTPPHPATLRLGDVLGGLWDGSDGWRAHLQLLEEDWFSWAFAWHLRGICIVFCVALAFLPLSHVSSGHHI